VLNDIFKTNINTANLSYHTGLYCTVMDLSQLKAILLMAVCDCIHNTSFSS